MDMLVFSVFDSAAGAFLEPFFSPTAETAIRGFRAACQRPDHQFAQFPQDYTLFQLGAFEAATGRLEALTTPHSLGIAVQFLARSSSTPALVSSEDSDAS